MIRLAPTAQESAHACAAAISGWLNRAIVSRGKAFLAVSGGATPRLMFESLAAMRVNWRRVHLFFVDERCVPPTDEQSNYRLALGHLIAPAGIPEANVHRIRGEDDPAGAAHAYAAEILSLLGPTGSFDVVQCGVGDDGHTASLFPGDPLVLSRAGICAPVWVSQKNQHRVTLLPTPISGARHLCVLVHGEQKRSAVRRALSPAIEPIETPARILDRSSTVWFLSPPDIYEDSR